MSFDKSFEHVVGLEGGFVDDPKDSGGATKYGITESAARAHGYTGRMRDLPLSVAKDIYRKSYWDKMMLDSLEGAGLIRVSDKMFDAGVNVGTGQVVKWLQQALNILNASDPMYGLIVEDGAMGNKTLQAARVFIHNRKEKADSALRKSINGMQVAFYFDLAEKRPKDKRFIFGWIDNRTD
jgi:lysozyme family protein